VSISKFEQKDASAASTSRRWFILTAAFLVTSLLISCVAALMGNDGYLQIYRTFWPQHWSFFTNLSTADQIDAYHIGTNSTLTQPEDQRDSWTSWNLGLSRRGDEDVFEINQISIRVPNHYWQTCTSPNATHCQVVADEAHTFTMINPVAAPTLCGLTAIATEKPALVQRPTLPDSPWVLNRVAVVNLTCRG
jgi:hypothetical protein